MINRNAYIGRVSKGKDQEIKEAFVQMKQYAHGNGNILTCSPYRNADIIIVYVESIGNLHLEALLPKTDLFEPIGICGERLVSMENIFSYNRPLSAEHWRRKTDTVGAGSVVRIKPGMLNSYVYYHYILQETTNRQRDKYGIIFVFQNLLFFYKELPSEVELPSYQGCINGTIPQNWHEIMNAHFVPWDDYNDFWKPMKNFV